MSDNWKELFSSAARKTRPSPVRELLKVIKQPGMISFAGGMPAPEVFPIDQFSEGSEKLVSEGTSLLQYGTTEGYDPLRSFLAKWTAPRMGREVGLDEILLTTGSQQVLDLFAWAMIDPGDVAIVEAPSYMAALTAFYNHGADFASVPVDGEGMVVSELPALIERLRKEGKKPKFIYTIVNFQNPAGATMTVERRKELAAIAERYGLAIFEDDPYGYVRFDGEHLPSIFSFDKAGNTIYAGSFSKILSPGVRIGWVSGPKDIIRQMAVFKQAVDLCSSPITQVLTYEYCRKGYLDSHLPNIVQDYRVKRDAMEESFRKHLAPQGITWVKPEGGFFYWLNTGNIDSGELARKALEKKVAILPGAPFCINPEAGIHAARINYTFSKPDVIEEGVSRLAQAIQEMKLAAK
ncbi:PLP-dependent aminotransferase family protein [uncultured Fretibacterium sp.]|mgnify:FL=1|uniref:aminotransferase-like domain-containing protein n=2 Tax=uncultured Fretibacterium sp. TaxID=1678694 RepID=UPI00325FA1C9